MTTNAVPSGRIKAIRSRRRGQQFVFYGDACSGVAGEPNEASLARTNEVVRRLEPDPDFVIFAGDEIVGLTTSETELRRQWRHWLDVEMGWLDRSVIPLYNTTSNHTTYDEMSERVFVDALAHLPRNGPPGQEGLSYAVRRRDLLLVFVHTSWSGLGGEGFVETSWLRAVLGQHADAAHRLVIGHHPVFPVNGFSGENQRELASEVADDFWNSLVDHDVTAYLCSHVLAFDVQVHRGVLQILSAGAATPHRMPADIEYLHAVQAAVDDDGLRYQVIDQTGRVRERLSWPPALAASTGWHEVPSGSSTTVTGSDLDRWHGLLAWRVSGVTASDGLGDRQTLLATEPNEGALPALWIGLAGRTRRLTVTMAPEPGRSPHYWFGPELGPGEPFDLQIGLHRSMGPGGVLWRDDDEAPWSSMTSVSPWGLERLDWPARWSIGAIETAGSREQFRGVELRVSTSGQTGSVDPGQDANG